MPYISWSERFSIDEPELDRQHERLFELINLLHDAILGRRGDRLLDDVFKDLEQYAFQHFAQEEAHMQRVGHTALAEHRANHASFLTTLADLRSKHAARTGHVGIEVIGFLTHWLIDHIMGWDRRFVADARKEP